MKNISRIIILSLLIFTFSLALCSNKHTDENKKDKLHFVDNSNVTINDSFWTPKFKQWSSVTLYDVFDKFEGKHLHSHDEQIRNNTFDNFDDIAEGKRGTGIHRGLPWFDGLVYETIRGASDLLEQYPDPVMEKRIDGYIDRIYAAQLSDPDGYINTYTDLIQPSHRWGDNGGFLRFQHDVYNAGMLIEAGVHYYKATGKTKLLVVATKFANYMNSIMGPAPKRNIIPSHSGPEESLLKLYLLYKENPSLKSKIGVSVNENDYYQLVQFWIENRGNHSGYPLWLTWGNDKSERWIKDVRYNDASFGKNPRPTWGDYAQDSISIFKQNTIEGHAVRATLLATGIAATALENNSKQYSETAARLWENMVGKRMFVTGGVGAIHHDEKFGPDYFLPTDAYLETCAAVGVGFFSQRMNELTADAKYMDEFERTLYNNILTGISLAGNNYTYQNPLNSHNHSRWEWHSCPCCPPMFLKIVSALPGYIYSQNTNNIFVNLFIGSKASINLPKNGKIEVEQKTNYPWEGKINLAVNPERTGVFSIKIRIPGWARGIENPYGLYTSDLESKITLLVNNKPSKLKIKDGYAEIKRKWKKGDSVELNLPIQPRHIIANSQVKDLNNMVTLASGPIIYCLEEVDNVNLDDLKFDYNNLMKLSFDKEILKGLNKIEGTAIDSKNKQISFTAIPYYAVGNRGAGKGYKVWLPVQK